MESEDRFTNIRNRIAMDRARNEEGSDYAKVRQIIESMPPEKLRAQAQRLTEEQMNPMTKVTKDIEISTYDLDYIVASSIQSLESSIDPVTEYHDWVQNEAAVVSDINTNGVEESELHRKDDMLENFDQREMDMRVCIQLYTASAIYGSGPIKERATEKLTFLKWKMSELRRLRAHLYSETAGKTKTNEEIRREEERAVQLDAYRNNMAKAVVATGLGYVATKAAFETNAFEDGIADHVIETRPTSTNIQEAKERIESYHNQKKQQYLLIMKQRGLPVPEDEDNWDRVASPELTRLQSMKGFLVQNFNANNRAYA